MTGEVHGPYLFWQEAVRTAFDGIGVDFIGDDFAAGASVLFEEQNINSLPVSLCPGFQMYGRGQAIPPPTIMIFGIV